MKKSISHIPQHKQEDLLKVINIIKKSTYKNIWAEMIILYWSYARWDFVVRDVVSEWWWTRVYESDFDILVITKKPTQEKNIRLSMEINTQIEKEFSIESHFNIIIEDIHHINKMLEETRYFYTDIKNEWIVLYDSEKYKLSESKDLSVFRRKQIQKEDFKMWVEDAESFFWHYEIDYEKWDYRIWAFSLHQTTEKALTAYLLVKTWYKPKTHDLEVIYKKVKEENKEFDKCFDFSDENESNHFELLRKAYIEARYSKTYKITPKELKFLEEKIIWIINLVNKLCKEELEK